MSDQKFRGYLTSVLTCRCARCRQGKLFKHPYRLSFRSKRNMEMNKTCPVCNQPTELEVGFYYGTGYVSYALTIALSIATVIVWWLTIGLSVNDNRFLYWLIFNSFLLILLQSWLMRLSRSIWFSWFVRYDPDWKHHAPMDVSERMNADQGENW